MHRKKYRDFNAAKIPAYTFEIVQAPRFLIVRFSSIGDIILTAPVVASLRSYYGPDARIDFVTLARFSGAAELIPGVDTIHLVKKSTSEIAQALQELFFDYLIDLHGNVRSRSLSKSLNILTLSVNKQIWPRFALVLGLRKKPIEHFVDRSLATLSPFNLPELEFPWGNFNTAPLPSRLSRILPPSFIVIAPGAAHAGKSLPHATLHAICDDISTHNISIVIVGGPDSEAIALELSSTRPDTVFSFCNQLSLAQTSFVLSKAQLALGGDTGAMHLAAAMGTPLISVWGCTRPSLGLSPWHPTLNSISLLPDGRNSRPCSRHGEKCRYKRKGKDLCINHVSPTRILDSVYTLLK